MRRRLLFLWLKLCKDLLHFTVDHRIFILEFHRKNFDKSTEDIKDYLKKILQIDVAILTLYETS